MLRNRKNLIIRKRRPALSRLLVAMSVVWCMVFYGIAPIGTQSQTGNLAPNSIQIDTNANLFDNDLGGGLLNSGATIDWVKDSLPNTDIDPDPNDAIAIGLDAGSTAASGGSGHWYGTRIVDGLNQNDLDIFLTGGKENDTSSWNVGPGSVGSAKYDISQAYLANNQQSLFLGMERSGNNGTTAFDFEFNQLAPQSTYIPTRSVGDVLLTFELQGSGGSGSATPHYFTWSGTTYVEQSPPPAGIISSINNAATPPAPWGYVNSNGNWVLSPDIPRFEFAEAAVPLTLLPGVNSCGGAAFVQIRTRSSSTANSDLKDTTKIFRFVFGGPTAGGQLTALCDLGIGYNGSTSRNSIGGTSNLSYSWQFQKFTGTDPTNDSHWPNSGSAVTGVSGTFTAPSAGTYRAKLTITEGSGPGACTSTITTNSATVVSTLDGVASLANDCQGSFTYGTTATGGVGSYTFVWQFFKQNGQGGYDDVTSTLLTTAQKAAQSGTITNFADGNYKATVTISNSTGLACAIPRNAAPIEVRNALTITAKKDSASVGSTFADASFSVTAKQDQTNAGSDALTYQWKQLISGTYQPITGATSSSLVRSLANIFTDGVLDTGSATINLTQGDNDTYNFRRGALTVRLHAFRTVNGTQCEANSGPVLLKALKAVDP